MKIKVKKSRVPEHTGQLPSEGNGGLGSSYIEVNITKQHLWLVKDGSVVLEQILSVVKKVILQDLHQMELIIYIIRKEIVC